MFLCFPKFLAGLDVESLATQVRSVGCDGVAIPVRDGYWVQPNSMAKDLPAFRKSLASFNLSADYAIIGQDPYALAEDPTPLAILAEHGVRQARIGYLRGDDPSTGFDAGRRALTTVAEHAQRLGIQVVVQCHHGTWHSSAEAAWHFVRGLPPEAIGVKIDPGNQCHEGRSDARRALALLGAHVAACGVKDAAWERTVEGGWRCRWVDVPSGCAGWPNWVTLLAQRGFTGPFVFHAFAHEREPDVLFGALASEVAWLRAALAAASQAAGKSAS
jgi:sugar phosphate isomerase/epimerase